jgi:uncharacterized membrane protein YdbT with pleckstrin-like domain
LLVCFVLAASLVFADEVFESKIVAKEVSQTYGSGTLSVATDVFTILVINHNTYMRIEVPKGAFDQLREGDTLRVTFNRGLFSNEIKALKLIQGVPR